MMSVLQGKNHDHLGMKLDFSKPGEVKIGMEEHINKMVDGFPEKTKRKAETPASDFCSR